MDGLFVVVILIKLQLRVPFPTFISFGLFRYSIVLALAGRLVSFIENLFVCF